MKKLLAIFAIAALILPVVITDHARALMWKQQESVWLKITNIKTGEVRMLSWDLGRYHFEHNVQIDVSHFKANVIKKAFGTDRFTFTYQKRTIEASWHNFKMVLEGTPNIGQNMSVKFV